MSARVLLLWPGTDGAAAGNFGVPQLVMLATYVRRATGAEVAVRDLETERAFGPVSLPALFSGEDGRGYDVIALGCYSSFDYLKCLAIAEIARAHSPSAVIAAGGYHASARPGDIVFDGSPFDVCIVGEGEKPLVKLVESVLGGAPLRNAVLGPDPIEDLAELPETDWTFLSRYQKVARRTASQTQLYLSRGCPFDCAFCMERAKREVSWRALPVDRAIDELERLHRFLDLRTWTVYFADALFGMKTSWRQKFLEALARKRLPVDKFWLLIRVDLVADEDLRLFAEANCGLGFGLESGDPGLLATIRKAGRLDDYLERMVHVSHRARELDLPWGANVIVGHPGETPGTLARSAAYLRELFLDRRGVTGFLSVDPFRLYPGSPIDAERPAWEARFGTVFHRPNWWHDGDPEFLAEWVDPSRELSYLARSELQHALLDPVLSQIESNFVYRGTAREYFLRAVREQAAVSGAPTRMHYLDRYYAWHRYLGRGATGEAHRAGDRQLAELARTLRKERSALIAERARLPAADADGATHDARACAVLDAIERVPRERFVPLDRVGESTRDVAVPLDSTGQATVSAMHAYARTFTLLEVGPGDRVLDLGCGTGYGAALLRELVGERGAVHAVELDPALAQRAARNLAAHDNVRVHTGDALDPADWGIEPGSSGAPVRKVAVGFALPGADLPRAWFDALPEGAVVVAPIETDGEQRLVRAVRGAEAFAVERLEPVRYVPARRSVAGEARHGEAASAATAPAGSGRAPREPRRLPVVTQD